MLSPGGWLPAFSSPVTMRVRGSSRSSSRSPTDAGSSVTHSHPAAYSGSLTKPALNVFEAVITPVAGSTRDRVMRGGYACADACQVRYRLPPVKASDGLTNPRAKMLSGAADRVAATVPAVGPVGDAVRGP